ncbi:MAG: DUF4190 domain-containing protein [Planctomycetota bacterium]|nr:DUF4190 domain-containing protein [Planctomycetota bacterium]
MDQALSSRPESSIDVDALGKQAPSIQSSAFEGDSGDFDADDSIYKAVSRAAIASLVLGVLATLSVWFVPLILLPIVGLILGIVGIKNIREFPGELTGTTLACLAIAVNALFLIGSPSLHTYTYLTEVPEGYIRSSFSELKSDAYGYDYPPPSALELNGKNVFLKGYIHPTSIVSGAAQKFILVPDLGTCCFGGQPKLTHMIEVTLSGDNFARYAQRQVKIAGTLHVDTQLKPIADLQGVYYQMDADIYRGY